MSEFDDWIDEINLELGIIAPIKLKDVVDINNLPAATITMNVSSII